MSLEAFPTQAIILMDNARSDLNKAIAGAETLEECKIAMKALSEQLDYIEQLASRAAEEVGESFDAPRP